MKQFEHVCFHYMTLGSIKRGMQLQRFRMVTIYAAHILPIFNTDEIPIYESDKSVVCLQEVVDEDNHHWLIYFDVYVGFLGE